MTGTELLEHAGWTMDPVTRNWSHPERGDLVHMTERWMLVTRTKRGKKVEKPIGRSLKDAISRLGLYELEVEHDS